MNILLYLIFVIRSAFSVKLGVVSYWDPVASVYSRIPSNTLAILTADGGVSGQTYADNQVTLTDIPAFQKIGTSIVARGIHLIGYVPSGGFKHQTTVYGFSQTWAWLDNQVAASFRSFPFLQGIFYDVAAPSNGDCEAYTAEYQRLRSIVKKYKSNATIAWNVGSPDECAVPALQTGEILVIFESPLSDFRQSLTDIQYVNGLVKNKGCLTWVMVDNVKNVTDITSVVQKAKSIGANYVYVTNIGDDWQNGDNTWGAPPPYLAQEVAAVNA